MSEERDRKLAELFASNAAELSGEEFASRIRRRIARTAVIARVRKAMWLSALVAIGVLYSARITDALVEMQASIEQTLQQYVMQFPPVTTIGKVVVVSLSICFVAWRRIRRRVERLTSLRRC